MLRICSLFVAAFLALPLWAGQPEITGLPRVIDADTLEVAGLRVRLGGIDAPEISERCMRADGRSWPCGTWASDVAHEMLAGQTLRCLDLGARSHNRVVGRCYLGGQDLAISLIERGAARVCLKYAREQGQELAYTQAEHLAAANRAGIFGGPLNPVAGFCLTDDAHQARAPETSGCAIKGNVSPNGKIYHTPGQRDYRKINMEKPGVRWFCSPQDAQAAGWRAALR